MDNENKNLVDYVKEALGSKPKMSDLTDRIIDMNPELTKRELQDKLGVEFDRAVERRIATKNDIEKIFRKYIDKFLKREKTEDK